MTPAINFGIVIAILFITISIFYTIINIAVIVYDSKTNARRNYIIVGEVLFIFSLFYAYMTIAENETLLHVFWAIAF